MVSPVSSTASYTLYAFLVLDLISFVRCHDFTPPRVKTVIFPRTNKASSDDPWGDPTINSTGSLFSNSSFLTSISSNTGNGSVEILANNPNPTPEQWVALGDSFAAGPGAGDPYGQDVGCMRGENAYPPQMQRDRNMPGPSNPGKPSKPRWDFKACTGDKTQNLTDVNNPNYQLGAVSESTSFLTLSIGGNDVSFSKILKRCVYGLNANLGSCDDFIANARKKMYSKQLYDNYNNVLNSALEKLNYEQRDSSAKRTVLYQTGYPQFFDSFTTQCDSVTFMWGFIGPKMTRELRREMNRLTHELNYVLQYWMDNINVHHTTQADWDTRYSTALDWADQDLVYKDHRFCRQGVLEPSRGNPDTWFFHLRLPATADSSNAGGNGTGAQNNTNAALAQFENTFTWEGQSATRPTWVTKTFHPTSAGFRETKNFMWSKLYYDDLLYNLHGVPIDIMVVGDIVAAGGYNPQSEIYQGFRGYLDSILKKGPLIPGGARQTFIGSQSAPYLGYLNHECYPDADLAKLYDSLKASPDLFLQRKLVLLMAGTRDMLYGEDVANAPARLVKIIDLIFDNDPLAVVIVGQIPMIGLKEDGSTFFNLQRRVASYNAAIAAIVNRMSQEKGRRILKVHTSTTTWEHEEGSFVTPNGQGYLRMAYDFLERIAIANTLGWFNGRPGFVSTATPASRGAKVTAGSMPAPFANSTAIGFNSSAPTDLVVCSQARPTGAPDSNGIAQVLFEGFSQPDFISKIACNESAVCTNTPDSSLPDLTQAAMNNGSTCVWASESKPGESNYYQLVINRPNTTSPLAQTVCPSVMQGILNTCVMKGNWYSGYWGAAEGLSFNLTNLNFPGSPLDTLPSTTSSIPLADQTSLFSSATPEPASATNASPVE